MTQEPAPCDLLVGADLILTLDAKGTILHDGAIAVRDRAIVDLGPATEIAQRWRAAESLPGKGRIAMAGLVNVHNHTPLMITRGMIEDIGFAPMYTPGIPQGHWLTEEDAYALSRLGMYELLRAGCTTVVDFYRYPSALARAAAELGLRAVIAGRVHDAEPGALATGKHTYSRSIGEASLRENAELIARWNGHDEGRIRCDWAPHAPDTCSDDLLREVKKLADAHGGNIHTHLSQLPAEITAVKERTGLTPPQLMDKLGLLNDRLIAAHCIHMDRADIELCGKSRMTVAHAPIGNAKGGRIAPIMELKEAGARIALCTDTFSGDMIEAMRWAISMQRINRQGNVLDARTVLDWGTREGAEAIGLGDKVGSLEVGKRADIVLLDSRSPTLAPMVDGYGVLVHSASGRDVDTVIVDGRVVLADGRLTLADGDAIVAEAQSRANALWQRAGRQPIA
ncbi:5-methylthioadenosine/S-adenosylhomocysteine deaminase [Enhydrobacter aerosaccus]|uniref:5-methylthioadenosine/S-adenosylhomocysteine deaminase n=1 Tax=Enhydrobacter aerosaccus TaxID=225324 RepID=A0A1T4JTQ7_9HYPH|nr:amidohydrolase family protein [Enhydrobacter aerosaccus]SJZ33485.1 5-methylthioadenosine/S-adenosylhomocysteine deaminase [Enhydrobacter aerosaccus]